MRDRMPVLKDVIAAMLDEAHSPIALLKGTRWADDPRLEAWRRAEESIGDLLWEVHMAVEDREGRLCEDCAQDMRDEATRP